MTGASANPTRFEIGRLQNRRALLEAAMQLFEERGLRATTLDEICRRADVSPRTFYNHFKTREHLYQALAEHRAEQTAAFFEPDGAESASFEESVPLLFARIGEFLHVRPAYRELMGEMLHRRTEGGSELVRSRPLSRAALRFVESGYAARGVPAAIPVETLADILLGTLTAAITNWSASEAYDLPGELARAARALVLLFAAAERRESAG